METKEYGVMKIYASSTDKIGYKMLYDFIAHAAKENGLAGVTVYRGIMGYGMSSSKISTSKFWELTEKLPVMIEIIDNIEALRLFYKSIEPEMLKMPKGCLITIEPIDILLMKGGSS